MFIVEEEFEKKLMEEEKRKSPQPGEDLNIFVGYILFQFSISSQDFTLLSMIS